MPVFPDSFLFLFFIFVLGAAVGSFVTMASYRIPRGKEIVFTPSHCTHCSKSLTARDLIPLLSWLMQRGRCRHCKTPVSPRYPLTELALGISFVGIVLLYGISISSLLFALLATELAILIITDLEHYIIPDSIQIAILITGIAYQIYKLADVQGVMMSMAAGLTLGLVLHYGYLYLRKKDALGFGDVKFLCVAGSWLPLTDFVPFMLFAGIMGIVTGLLWRWLGRGAIFPFGPALAFSLFINILFPDMIQWVHL